MTLRQLNKRWIVLVIVSLVAFFIPLKAVQAQVKSPSLPVATDQWFGEFYSNQNLKGTPKFVGSGFTQKINDLNFNWKKGSPLSGIPTDHFSALFHRRIILTSGTYQLQVGADDGIKVYVDGKLTINQWKPESFHLTTKTLNLSSGMHVLTVLYYEQTGNAALKVALVPKNANVTSTSAKPVSSSSSLNITSSTTSTRTISSTPVKSLPVATDQWYGEFYSNQSLKGTPKFVGSGFTQKITDLNFNWKSGSPLSGIPTDHFSALFHRRIILTSGTYQLQVGADDGIKVYVDGKLTINQWKPESFHLMTKTLNLSSGTHVLTVLYYEQTGNAALKVELDPDTHNTTTPTGSTSTSTEQSTIPLTSTEWNGAYYPSGNLTGTPDLTKTPSINFNWGTAAPASGIPSNNFSAVFQEKMTFSGSPTDLQVWANGGVQVYLDNKLVIDQWNSSSDGFWHQVVTPSSGTHTVVIKYKKVSGSASLKFQTGDPYITLDLRKPSDISVQDITNFFDAHDPTSPLKADASQFIDAQKTYGVNAAYLVAHSVLETGWGKSDLSIYKHNLYGYGAYGACPFTCGYYFPNDLASIDLVAYDVSQNYLMSSGSYYSKLYGPNLKGMNINYAADQTWSSSIAALMEEVKPYNAPYYSNAAVLTSNVSRPATYGTDLPNGSPYPMNVVINFPSETTAIVNSTVNIRSLPYVSSSTLIGSVPTGTSVKVLGYNSDVSYDPKGVNGNPYHWYRVQTGSQQGWIYGQYLTFQNLFQVNTPGLNVRTMPEEGTTPTIPPALSDNQFVNAVLDNSGQPVTSDSWYEIIVPNSTQTGWVYGSYINQISH